MSPVHIAFLVIWVLFWAYWLYSATHANRSRAGSWRRDAPLRGLSGVLIIAFIRISSAAGLRDGALAVHSPVLITLGFVLLLAGLAFAIWARVHLGRNWGMPMTQRAEPELITSGPYAYVRHPIYSGLLLAAVGTATGISAIGFGVIVLLLPYFLYAAHVEERNLTATFPSTYPEYRAHSKRLIPFVL